MLTAKHHHRCLVLALAGALFASPAKAEPDNSRLFHLAQTPAEKKLDAMIRESERDPAMVDFLLNKTADSNADGAQPAPKTPPHYDHDFTPALLTAITQTQNDLVKKDCGEQPGAEDDVVCGIDSDPVSCAQDGDDKPYVYRTIHADAKSAEITYRWQNQSVPQDIGTYHLVKTGKDWVIDGIACPDLKFNMK